MTKRDPTLEPIGLPTVARVVTENRAALAKEIDALAADATRLRARGNPGHAAELLALRERLRTLDEMLARPIVLAGATYHLT